MGKISILALLFVSAVVGLTASVENKYTKEANVNFNDEQSDKPFRMAKINLVWQKAKQVISSFMKHDSVICSFLGITRSWS